MANRAETQSIDVSRPKSGVVTVGRWHGQSATDDRVYVDLISAMDRVRSEEPIEAHPAAGELQRILFAEARRLDERRYRDWLGMLTEDFIYWVPANADCIDPRMESSTNFDDLRRITDRVALIETGSLYAQIPPSRTCRIISNIEIWDDGDDAALVRSNFVIWEHRRGHTNSFAGWQRHKLVRTDASWNIKQKTINLINAEDPLGNITFIL